MSRSVAHGIQAQQRVEARGFVDVGVAQRARNRVRCGVLAGLQTNFRARAYARACAGDDQEECDLAVQ